MATNLEVDQQGQKPTAGFRPRRLAHANLWVKDVEGSNEFYRDVIGLTEVYRRPAAEGIFLSNGNTYHDVALMDADGPAGHGRPPGLNHLAFELENEIDLVAGYEAELRRGLKFTFSESHEVAHSVYFDDPDGNGVEIYADVRADWRTRRSGVITKNEPEWKPGSTKPVEESCYPDNPPISPIPNAIFDSQRTSNATIVCQRYPEMCEFYTSHVALRALVGGPATPFTILCGSVDEPSLLLFPQAPGRAVGLHHVSFEVTRDLHDAFAELVDRSLGVVMFIEDRYRECAFVEDPSGLLLRMYRNKVPSVRYEGSVDPELALFLA